MGVRKTTEERKIQAAQIHNNKYDYSLWPTYVTLNSIVQNICPTHGVFSHSLKQHIIQKSGCPKCSGIGITTEERKIQAAQIHNNKYDYSLWPDVINIKTTIVTSICPIHGKFNHTLNTHIHCACGCPLCLHKAQQLTNLTTYGRSHHKQTHWTPEAYEKLNDREWLYDQHTHKKQTQSQIASTLNVNVTTVGRYLEKYNIQKIYGFSSKPETDLANWIKSQTSTTVLLGDRSLISPFELDIVLPEYKLAIEYCGLYWHSEQQNKDRHYHKHKYEACAKQNIQLLTIFEDEWFNRQPQVKSKILSMISNRNRVYARKCVVRSVSISQKKQFFEQHHIQGNGPGSINYGLFHKEKMIACISFITQKDQYYYLNRYATNVLVIGGFSKLLTHFQRNHQWKKIISFADLRWSNGNLYKQTGWTLEQIIPPDYYYSPDAIQRFHKFNYRRKNLPKLLQHFDPTKSETANCLNNGILRIWDCGKMKFTLTKPIGN